MQKSIVAVTGEASFPAVDVKYYLKRNVNHKLRVKCRGFDKNTRQDVYATL